MKKLYLTVVFTLISFSSVFAVDNELAAISRGLHQLQIDIEEKLIQIDPDYAAQVIQEGMGNFKPLEISEPNISGVTPANAEQKIGEWVIRFLKTVPRSRSVDAVPIVLKALQAGKMIDPKFDSYRVIKDIFKDYVFTEFPYPGLLISNARAEAWGQNLASSTLIQDVISHKTRDVGGHLVLLLQYLGDRKSADLLRWIRIKATILAGDMSSRSYLGFRTLVAGSLASLKKRDVHSSSVSVLTTPVTYCASILQRAVGSSSNRFRSGESKLKNF